VITALPKSGDQDLFPRGPTLFARLLFIVLLSGLLLILDHRSNQLQPVRAAMGLAVYPLQIFADLPVNLGGWASENVSSRNQLIRENSQLREQQLIMQARLLKMAALETENRRIRALLQSTEILDEEVLIGEILAVDMDPYRHQVLIDKGSQHGAYDGQPLVDAYGVAGQLVETGPISATAMLITDPNHALPIELNRNGLRSVARGSGKPGLLELPYLPNASDIKVGDLLVTSGLGGRFPPGYPVALVTQVRRQPGEGFMQVFAQPTAKLDRNRQILLVWREAPRLKDFAQPPKASIDAADSSAAETQ